MSAASPTTPRNWSEAKKATIGRPGDNTDEKIDEFTTQVIALLKHATGGVVHIEYTINGSFETEYVLSTDSLQMAPSIARLLVQYLGNAAQMSTETRKLPRAGMPAYMTADQETIVIKRVALAKAVRPPWKTVLLSGASIMALCGCMYLNYYLLTLQRRF